MVLGCFKPTHVQKVGAEPHIGFLGMADDALLGLSEFV